MAIALGITQREAATISQSERVSPKADSTRSLQRRSYYGESRLYVNGVEVTITEFSNHKAAMGACQGIRIMILVCKPCFSSSPIRELDY